jgi:general secretion pathway protein D
MNQARRLLATALLFAGFWTGSIAHSQQQSLSGQEHGATPQAADRLATESSLSPVQGAAGGTNELRMNFRNASVDSVLDYLSSAAGFIIHKEADPKGSFDFLSKDLLSKEQALRLVNSVLKKNGYGLICNGRILTVVSQESIKTADLEIDSGNNPDDVGKSDEVITQIIPVHYANASQLLNNLQLLLPSSASLSVNESANSLILVASKTDVRRMLRIVKALDTSIATISSIKVFPLRYADAKQLATVIQQFFSTQGGSNATNAFVGFGFPGFGPPPEPTTQANRDAARNSAALKVTAAADEASNSLIVSASADLLGAITEIVQQIDRPVTAITEVRIFELRHADPAEIAQQLAQLFPDTSKTGSDQNQQSAPVNGPPGPGGGAGSGPGGGSGGGGQAGGPSGGQAGGPSGGQGNAPSGTQPGRGVSQSSGPGVSQGGGPAGGQGGGPGGGQGGGPGGFIAGPGFAGGPFGPGGPPGGGSEDEKSTWSRKSSQVIAVADPRTSSLLVSASSLLMPQIARMIEELDASSARQEIVKVYELQNADPQDVNQVLQDLFSRNSSTRNNNNNNQSLLGQGNPLTTREAQQQAGGYSQSLGLGNGGGPGGVGSTSIGGRPTGF